MKIEELVGSLLTYEFSLPHVKKAKSIALKATKGKNSSNEESDDEDDFDGEFFRIVWNWVHSKKIP